MKRSDTLPSASSSLPAEVGVTEFSAVPADNLLEEGISMSSCESSSHVSECIDETANQGNRGAEQKPSGLLQKF